MLDILLIGGVEVVKLFGSIWSPSLRGNKIIIKDLLSVDLNESSISVVSNSTTIVGLSNEVLNSGPVNWSSLVVSFIDWLSVNLLTKVVGDQIVTYLIIGIIESISNIPAE